MLCERIYDLLEFFFFFSCFLHSPNTLREKLCPFTNTALKFVPSALSELNDSVVVVQIITTEMSNGRYMRGPEGVEVCVPAGGGCDEQLCSA